MNPLKVVFNKIKQVGFINACKLLLTFTYDLYFDYKFNIDTVSWVSLKELDVEEDQRKHAVLYQGTRIVPLRILFKKLNIPKEKVFVDIGCGKGRVLIFVAELGFKEVRGIEFSSNLCAIAENNISNYRIKTQSNTNFEVIPIDASNYVFKDDEEVIFMYNPFDGFILDKVLQNLSISLEKSPRKILIIYGNPFHSKLIEEKMTIVQSKKYTIWELDLMVYEIE